MENDLTPDYTVELEKLITWRRDATEQSRTERANAERDRDYRDNRQFTQEEMDALKERGQPVVSIDKIGPKAEYLAGLERQQRTDPKAHPRTPQHEEEAEAWTEVLRFACDDQDYPATRSAAFDNLSVEGIGVLRVSVEQGREGVDVKIEHVRWDRFFRDPHAARLDFSDARYLGLDVWMDVDEAQALYGKAEIDNVGWSGNGETDQTYDDKPVWFDRRRQRIRIVQMWHKSPDGEWYYAEFTGGGILKEGRSPYISEKDRTEHDLVAMSCYVDRDLRRYGELRRMIDPQDNYNKLNSKATHLLNVSQVIADEDAVPDQDAARHQVARPDGYVATRPGARFDVERNADLAAGQFNLLQMRAAELDAYGPNSAQAGQNKGESGVATNLKQQGGAIGLGELYDRLKVMDHLAFTKIANRIRQFWTAPKWIRVTDDERNVRFVGLNQQMTRGEMLLQRAKQQGVGVPPEIVQQMQADPAMQEMVVMNHLQGTPVDIIIDDAPPFVTQQAETFAALSEMVKSGIQIPPNIVLKAAPLPSRTKVEMLEGLKEAAERPDPKLELEAKKAEADARLKQEQMLLEAQNAEAERGLKSAEMALKQVELEIKKAELAIRQEELALEREQADWQRSEAGMNFMLQREKLSNERQRDNARPSTH